MKKIILLGILAAVCALPIRARAQYAYYKFIFRGIAYQTNAAGNIVATPITDQTLLADRASEGGITNLSTVAIAYHLNGDPKGDTVEVVSTNGTSLTFEFGYWFGGDTSLGRYAVTNLAQTEIRGYQYIYTLNNSAYTYDNSDSSGAAFICKRFLIDTNGNTNLFVEGPMSWSVAPQGTNGPIVVVGNFTIGQPLF